MESVCDRALTEIGQNGYYQKKFDVLYNVFLSTFWTMTYMNILLLLVIVPYTCQVPNKPDNVSETSWNIKYLPIDRYNTSTSQYVFSSCYMYVNPDGEGNETKGCDKYSYDKTWYETTVPSDNDWVCEKELYVANVFAYSRFGEAIGSLVFGWFGDVYGRRLTYIVSLVIIVFGRFLSLMGSHSYVIFLLGCTIAGFPSWSVVQSANIISMEISSPERRTTTMALRIIASGVAMIIMPLLYWWLRKWNLFLIATTAPLIIYVIISWSMIESPRWLWTEGRSKDCVKYLKKIAKVNKTHLNKDTEKELLTATIEKAKEQKFGTLALFSSWRLTFNTILQIIIWIAIALTYNVILLSYGGKTDSNPFIEFAWQSVAEIPANILGAWLADRIGRRYTGLSSFAVCVFASAMMAYREYDSNVWIRAWWFGSLLFAINRFSITVTYYIINLLNMELYPTCIRQSGMSMGNLVGGGATALAPYVLHLGRHVNVCLPGIIMTVVCILGGISSYLLPETLNKKLPETLEDAQSFGRHQTYISVKVIDNK